MQGYKGTKLHGYLLASHIKMCTGVRCCDARTHGRMHARTHGRTDAYTRTLHCKHFWTTVTSSDSQVTVESSKGLVEGAVTAHPLGTLRALSVLYDLLPDARAGTGRGWDRPAMICLDLATDSLLPDARA